MKLKNITVQIGGFHDHWLRNGSENPTLLMAAMQYYNYDFICLLDNCFGEKAQHEKCVIEEWMPGKKVHMGIEMCYDWGHVVCVGNSAKNLDLASLNWREELKKIHAGGGFVALAHIGYPYGSNPTFTINEFNEIIDNDYVDAVQLERTIDWQWIEPRVKDNKKIPLAGGWDAHYLLNGCDDKITLYTKDATPDKHIDSAPGMRTIVFAEDNSLESLKKAIRDGKSVLEHVETGKLFGSSELIDLLISENYFELMNEHVKKHINLKLETDALIAYNSTKMKFPSKGVVTIPANPQLDKQEITTDEEGYIYLDSIPMPVMQEKNHLPFYWKGEDNEHMWAVRVFNNIQCKVYPTIRNSKRVIVVETKQDIDCTIKFYEPVEHTTDVCAKAGEELFALELNDTVPQIFNCKFDVESKNGGFWSYNQPSGVAIALKSDKDWSECPVYCCNTQEQCGGFGSNRPYPGEDVFSGKGQFKWDEIYLYFRCDIVDAVHISPPSGHYMYRSDCTCMSFDPELKRSRTPEDTTSATFGFPVSGPEIYIEKKSSKSPYKPKLFLEETDYGRIVTAWIPWESIKVNNPKSGLTIGLHFSFLNDNGTGLIDNVNWPAPAPDGRMEQPDDYGTLYLL